MTQLSAKQSLIECRIFTRFPYLEIFDKFLYLPVFRWKICVSFTSPLYSFLLLLTLRRTLAETVFCLHWSLTLQSGWSRLLLNYFPFMLSVNESQQVIRDDGKLINNILPFSLFCVVGF